jgi:hypothetical protein
VVASLSRVAAVPLSTFGRAFAAGGYALAKVLTACEFAGLPPPAVLQELQAATAKLVDRSLAPASRLRRATGVPQRLLPGHPTAGGFGLLPLVPHVRARHAMWAVRLIAATLPGAPLGPRWQHVATALLREQHPAFLPLGLATAAAGHWELGGFGCLTAACPALERLVGALALLPPLQDVRAASEPLEPGPWCWACPLWGNPLLRDAAGYALEHHAPGSDLCVARVISTVGDLVLALDTLVGRGLRALVDGVWGGAWRLPPFLRSDAALLRERLDGLWNCVPVAWIRAARPFCRLSPAQRAEAGVPAMPVVAGMLAARLGWRLPDGAALPLLDASVKSLTVLQLGDVGDARGRLHAAFVAEALPASAPEAERLAAVAALVADALPRLWRIRWENAQKEVLWRLAVDGVPMPGNSHMHGSTPKACACGGAVAPSPRMHHFWDCPVAQAVVSAVSAVVGAAVPRAALWLVLCPDGLCPVVWDVVCLAALSAMERGRRAAVSASAAAAGAAAARRAAAEAVADFWGRLASFVALRVAPASWADVPPDHPFVGRTAFRRLRLNRPP